MVAAVIEQLTDSPGNLSRIRDYFSHPPEASIGVGRGLDLLLVHLDPSKLFGARLVTTGPTGPGVVVAVAWAASLLVAWRLGRGPLLRLHAVVGVASALALVSLSRIFGFVWFYLSLWAWGIGALTLVAIGWTAAALVGSLLPDRRRGRATRAVAAGLAGVTVVFTVLLTIDARHTRPPLFTLSETLGRVAPATVAALRTSARRDTASRHPRPRYLVTWTDTVAIGAQGYGLLLELERHGLSVGAGDNVRAAVTPHRVLRPADATAVVHLSVGPDIAVWRARPGARQLGYADPRSRAERVEFRRLRADVVARLRAAGVLSAVGEVDQNLFIASLDRRVPSAVHRRIVRMLDLGLPIAVFVEPIRGARRA